MNGRFLGQNEKKSTKEEQEKEHRGIVFEIKRHQC